MSFDDIRQDDRDKFKEMCESSEYEHIVKNILLKRIIKQGDSEEKCPEKDCKVTVHYTGKLLNGTQFDSSEARNEPFEFNVGLGSVIKGWDQGVPTMCIGERCELVIHPSFGYGASGQGSIPASAVLTFEVELLDFIEDDHEYPQDVSARFEAAQVRKNQGGELFTKQKYRRALRKYEKAAELLESHTSADEELLKKIHHLRAQAFANCGICQTKMKDIKNGLKNTLEALKIIEENNVNDKALHVKVVHRAMQAYLDLKDPEAALKLGESSGELTENNNIKQLIVTAKQNINKIQAQRDGLYKKMMLGAVGKQ